MNKLENVLSFIAWFLLGIGGVLTIEEAISVAYVGVSKSILSDIALWCLIGSAGVVFIGGIVLGAIEAIKGLEIK